MKSLRKAAVSDFRDVIETQVQCFQGNIGLQLTCFNATDPVVMPETVRRRNGDNLVLSKKPERISEATAGPQAGPRVHTVRLGALLQQLSEEKPATERPSLIPTLFLWLERLAHRHLQASRHFFWYGTRLFFLQNY